MESLASAKYVEAVVPVRDMTAFVCENAEDVTKLVKICRQRNLRVNAFKAPSHRGPVKAVYRPKVSIEVLK